MTHDTPPKRIWADQDNLTWVEEFPGEAMKDCEAPYILASEVAALIREAEARGMERAASKSETRHQLHLEQVRITNEWIAECDRLAAANAVLEAKVAGLEEAEVWYKLTWTAAPRPPAHPTAMTGRQNFDTLEKATAFFKRLASDAEFVSLTKFVMVQSDASDGARAALATQEAGNG